MKTKPFLMLKVNERDADGPHKKDADPKRVEIVAALAVVILHVARFRNGGNRKCPSQHHSEQHVVIPKDNGQR